MKRVPRIVASLILVELLVVATIVFIVWAVRSPPGVQAFLVRLVPRRYYSREIHPRGI